MSSITIQGHNHPYAKDDNELFALFLAILLLKDQTWRWIHKYIQSKSGQSGRMAAKPARELTDRV